MSESVKSATDIPVNFSSVIVNKIVYVTQRDKFITEMITNVIISNYQHKDIFVIFFTFRLLTPLTNASLEDVKNATNISER